jgi:hypothetical protein
MGVNEKDTATLFCLHEAALRRPSANRASPLPARVVTTPVAVTLRIRLLDPVLLVNHIRTDTLNGRSCTTHHRQYTRCPQCQ